MKEGAKETGTNGNLSLSTSHHCRRTSTTSCDAFPHLAPHQSFWSNDFFEEVLAHMRVHSTQWIVKEVDVCFLVHGTSYTDTLLLTTTQIDTLQYVQEAETLKHKVQEYTMSKNQKVGEH